MRKGRWHGAAVTEGSIRLRVSTDRVQKGKILRSLSQPTADSSLYAREPTCDPSVSLGLTAPFAQGSPLIRHAFGVPPSPEGKATSGGGSLTFPWGRLRTLSWERVAGRSPDGCGAVQGRTRCRPSSGESGATFPQGKVENPLVRRGFWGFPGNRRKNSYFPYCKPHHTVV